MTVNRRVLPSISALTAFEAAARCENFTEAGDEIGLTQGAVSRQIATLEDFLGVQLFERDKQRVTLTKAGRGYATEIRPALHRIGNASLRMMVSKDGAGIINLASLPTFGTRWLIPRLPSFFAAHPDINVNLHTRVEPFDFAETDIDAAIHFGHDTWPGTTATRLMGEEIIPVCSQAFLDEHTITEPYDLLRAPLLHQRTRPTAWQDWFRSCDITVEKVPGMRFEQFAMVAQAAAAGMGVAILPRFLIIDELASGRLVPPFSKSIRNDTAYYYVYPEWNSNVEAILALGNWLSEQMKDFEKELETWSPLIGTVDRPSYPRRNRSMNVTDAVTSRMSCRAFKADPVPNGILNAILDTARWSPSGSNLQPWHIHAVTGQKRHELVALLEPRYDELPAGEGEEFEIQPSPLTGVYRNRAFKCGMTLYESIGIKRRDRQARYAQFAQNLTFFGAPVGLFFTVDRMFGPGQWGDIGMLMQSIMLLAREHDLHTCAQQAWDSWPKTVGTFLNLPDNEMLVCGMALGYMDGDHPINSWRTEREEFETCVTIHE